MSGAVLEVLGHPRLLPDAGCPEELREALVTLKSSDGRSFELDAASACMSRAVLTALLGPGDPREVALPLPSSVLAKVVEYLQHHKGEMPQELQVPMPSEDLVVCGASKWDVAYVKVEKDVLFELMSAASLLGIPSLMLLTAAKAASLIKEKESTVVRKLIGVKRDDMEEEEEEELDAKFVEDRRKRGVPNPENQPLNGVAAILHGVACAAEKNGILSMDGKEPCEDSLNDSITSWNHINWRAVVLADWRRLEEAPDELRSDRALMFAVASMSHGQALYLANSELRDDRQLVLHCVSLNPRMLSEASQDLRNDREFVMEAVMINRAALEGASGALRGDRELVLQVEGSGKGSSALKGASESLQADEEFVLQCVALNAEAFKYASWELRKTLSFALKAAQVNGLVLRYAPRDLRANADLVAAAVEQNPEAALFAHTSRRVELGLATSWDTDKAHKDKVDSDFKAGKRAKEPLPLGKRVGYQLSKYWNPAGGVTHMINLQKCVQFSAMNTMAANVGQFNYISSNSYLDKLPFYERPTMDGFTLMWGPVGAIGMRAKAFASADMLQAAPENLMSILDATKILHQVCCLMDPPEWFNPCFFDWQSREGFLRPTAGTVSDHNSWGRGEASGGGRVRRRGETAELEGEQEARSLPELESGPLATWPALAGPKDYPLAGSPFAGFAPEPPRLALEEGARVRLTGLPSQNGLMGTVSKHHLDGRWKVMLDDKMGKALLKPEFLVIIAAAHKATSGESAPSLGPPIAEDEPEVVDEDLPAEEEAAPREEATAELTEAQMPAAPLSKGAEAKAEPREALAQEEAEEAPLSIGAEAKGEPSEVPALEVAEAALPCVGAKAAAVERRRQAIEEKRAAKQAKQEELKAALKAAAEARKLSKLANQQVPA